MKDWEEGLENEKEMERGCGIQYTWSVGVAGVLRLEFTGLVIIILSIATMFWYIFHFRLFPHLLKKYW